MPSLPEPHPDTHLQIKAVKEIKTGGRQAIQTEAMNAYFDVFDATGDKGKAEEAYKMVHKKYNS